MDSLICAICLMAGVTARDLVEEWDSNESDGGMEEIESDDGASSKTVLPATTQHLLSRIEHHSSTASDRRLTKPAKNSGLQKSDNFRFLKQTAYKNAAKKNSGTVQQVTSKDITFIIYLHMYDLRNHLVKLPTDSLNISVKPTTKVNEVLKLVLSRAKEAFLKNPRTRDYSTPKFDLDNVQFSSLKRKSLASRSIVFDAESLSLTVGRFFENLNADSMLSESDLSRRSISVNLKLFEPSPEDVDQEVGSIKGKRKKGQVESRQLKRCRFSESEDDELGMDLDVKSGSSPPSTHVKSSGRVTRSATRRARELKVSVSDSAVDKVQQEDDIVEAQKEPFISPYHSRPLCRPVIDLSLYDMHIFCRVLTTVTPDGEIFLYQSNVTEAVLVHKNWPQYRNALKGPSDGYLGKGVRKYAFKGYIGNSQFALFLLGGLYFMSGIEDAVHSRMIKEEYLSLIKAHYHLSVFKERASYYDVQLPEIYYNAEGAFLGNVLENREAMPPPSYGAPDTRTMRNSVFFAAPFLDFTGRTEIRFTGGDGVPRDREGDIDDILAAFTHSTLVDSCHTMIVTDIQGVYVENDKLVLYDPQIHTQAGNWWEGDRGRDVINSFLAEHICNAYCRKMGLEGVSPKSIPPLTILPFAESPTALACPERHPSGALTNPSLQTTGHATSAIGQLQVPLAMSQAGPSTGTIGGCVLPPLSQLTSAIPATPRMSFQAKGRGPLRTGFSPRKL